MSRYVLVSALFCVVSLESLPAQGKRSVADLVADLKKGDKERFQALAELEARGDKAGDAVQALIDLLDTKDEDVRLQATIVLGKIGRPAVEPLTKALTSKDEDIRLFAVWGLSFAGPQAKSAAPAVVKALGDPSAQVRRKAAYAIGRINADPEIAVSALVAALDDKDDDVRSAVAGSLPKMGKTAVPPLRKALASDRVNLRNTAIRILGEIGPDAAPAIP